MCDSLPHGPGHDHGHGHGRGGLPPPGDLSQGVPQPVSPDRNERGVGRSISLPHTLRLLSLGDSPPRKDGVADPPAPASATKRVLSESQSLDPRRGAQRLNEVAADTSMLDIQHNDSGSVLFGSAAHLDSLFGPSLEPDLVLSPPTANSAVARALACPDILFAILSEMDAQTVIPHELSQSRRKPLSLQHAKLIFGNTKRAQDAWENALTRPTTSGDSEGPGLYSCLFVNRLWHDVAQRVLETNIHFGSNQRWTQFALEGRRHLSRRPKALVLHKLNAATQVELDLLCDADIGGRLEWLEFYTCPMLSPPAELFKGGHITRLVLPGCGRVTDRTMSHVAAMCPRLVHLDLRACEQVSDRGLKIIAKYCNDLQLLNVGRTRNGHFVTYKGIKHLARQTQVSTLGLAGCDIDDRSIWELAFSRGPSLQRLSLNNCRLLTDASIPRVIGYMPNLTVLEIRGCVQIHHMKPLAQFRRYRVRQGQSPLLEGCEIIERRLQYAEHQLRREICRRILADCQTWLDADDENNDDTNQPRAVMRLIGPDSCLDVK